MVSPAIEYLFDYTNVRRLYTPVSARFLNKSQVRTVEPYMTQTGANSLESSDSRSNFHWKSMRQRRIQSLLVQPARGHDSDEVEYPKMRQTKSRRRYIKPREKKRETKGVNGVEWMQMTYDACDIPSISGVQSRVASHRRVWDDCEKRAEWHLHN